MADGLAYTPGSGATVLTDDTGAGGHAQVVKLAISTDGSGTLIPADASGLLVNLGTNNDVTVTGTVTAELSATDNAVLDNIDADLTTIIGHVDGVEGLLTTIDADTSALAGAISGTEVQVDIVAALPAGTNNIGDVDVLTVPAPLSTTGGGTEAAALRVTLANDSTGVVSVDDNGASLTVDGTVAVSGTVTVDGSGVTQPVSGSVTANAGTNLNTSALALETGGNLAGAATSLAILDDWDETDRAKVNVIVGQAGITAGAGAVAASTPRVTLASDDPAVTSLQLIDDAVFADDATFTPATSKVVASGGYVVAHGSNPDAADAGDAGAMLMNRHRIQFVIGGHPNIITRSVRIADSDGAQTDASMVGTIAAGTKVAVTMLTVTCDAANTGATAVKVGFGATSIPADSATGAAGVLLDHEGISPGSGMVIGSGAGLIGIGADGEELRLSCEDPAGGFVIVTFSYFTIES